MKSVHERLLGELSAMELLTMDGLERMYKVMLKEELTWYFYMQNDEFVDEVYSWIVEAPRDEWVLRLVYVKVRFQQNGVWPKDWAELYDAIKLDNVNEHDVREASGMVYMMRTFRKAW